MTMADTKTKEKRDAQRLDATRRAGERQRAGHGAPAEPAQFSRGTVHASAFVIR